MAYTNFKPTIWSKQVQMDLAKLMVFREICNTNFQGEAGRGKTVKIVGISKPTVKTYAPGTAIAAAETPADTSMELKIDKYKYTNFLVDDVDDAQSHVDIMKSLMKGSAEQHATVADSYIASLVTGAKTSIAKTIATPEEAKDVEVMYGPNIKPFPTSEPMGEDITAKAVLKVGLSQGSCKGLKKKYSVPN